MFQHSANKRPKPDSRAVRAVAHLNGRQREAVETVEGPVMIIAGAGSGKTRVITSRIAHLLSTGVDPTRVLALTFTNKAAHEMAGRVSELVRAGQRGLTLSTFHSFGAEFLRSYIPLLGYRSAFTIYDSGDRQALIKEVAVDSRMDSRNLDLYRLEGVISGLKMDRYPMDEVDEEIHQLFKGYQEHLKSYNAVDFDDLILLPIEIMRRSKETRDTVTNRYRYVMVDEFQDTSAMQYRLLKIIGSQWKNVCVVGDDDQSIYSWRGASYQNLESFQRDFPGTRFITLDQNYRSTGTILEAANNVISQNANRRDKTLWTDSVGGDPIGCYLADDDSLEARFIAQTIKTTRHQRHTRYGEFGILIRANSLSRSIEEALREANLPYRVSGGLSFYQRSEVRDVLAYLKTIANPDDDVSLIRVLNRPRRGIGKKTLDVLSEVARNLSCSLFSAARAACVASDSPLAKGTRDALQDFTELVERYAEHLGSGRNMADSLAALVEDIGYWGHLVSQAPRPEVARWRYDNVESLIEGLRRYATHPDTINPTLRGYLTRVAIFSSEDEEEDPDLGSINLMTVHAAKGLEFDTVFVAGVEHDLFPHIRSIQEGDRNIEEERRLFYVAITRARRRLILSASRTRIRRGQSVETGPSSFLDEIPSELVQVLSGAEDFVTDEEAADGFADLKARFHSEKPAEKTQYSE